MTKDQYFMCFMEIYHDHSGSLAHVQQLVIQMICYAEDHDDFEQIRNVLAAYREFMAAWHEECLCSCSSR